MKALIKNPWFWVLIAAAIIVTAIVARSKTGDTIAENTTKLIPLGSDGKVTTTTTTEAKTA